jgi:hypothetical protein
VLGVNVCLGDYAARLFLDNTESLIFNNDIKIRQADDKTYFEVIINKQTFEQMYNSNEYSIQLGVPRAHGGFFAGGKLQEKDRKSLKLTLNNCI